MGLKFARRALPSVGRPEGSRRHLHHARHARPIPRPGHRDLHLRRALLAGRSPSQGTELCTVAEAMYSLELLEGITGDARLGDRLEKLAFNAFPATFKKDMMRASVRPAGEPGRREGLGAAGSTRVTARREPLRPGAELRLLHRQHAPGLAEARDAPMGQVVRRRARGDGARAVCRRDEDRRQAGQGRGRDRLSVLATR